MEEQVTLFTYRGCQQITDVAVQDIEVAFRGVEVGELEALLKTASPQYKDRPYSSALEDSAVAGVISP